jgi:RimJ/RimL family protein N-acetyltransferase
MNGKCLKKKVVRNLRDYGLLLTLTKGISYLFRLLYESRAYRIYKIDLDWRHTPQLAPAPFVFRLLGHQERKIIGQIEEMEEWLDNKLARKLQTKSFCMVVLDREKVAGFNLVTMDEVYVPLINVMKVMRPGSAWSEQITIHNDYRNRGLATELRHRVYAELKNRGIGKFYGGSLACNTASLKLAKKAGFTILAEVIYCRVFSCWQWWEYRRVRV